MVDGFDRTDQSIALNETVSGIANRPNLGTFQRVITHRINNFSYVVEHGRVIDMIENSELAQKTDRLHEYLGV